MTLLWFALPILGIAVLFAFAAVKIGGDSDNQEAQDEIQRAALRQWSAERSGDVSPTGAPYEEGA